MHVPRSPLPAKRRKQAVPSLSSFPSPSFPSCSWNTSFPAEKELLPLPHSHLLRLWLIDVINHHHRISKQQNDTCHHNVHHNGCFTCLLKCLQSHHLLRIMTLSLQVNSISWDQTLYAQRPIFFTDSCHQLPSIPNACIPCREWCCLLPLCVLWLHLHLAGLCYFWNIWDRTSSHTWGPRVG